MSEDDRAAHHRPVSDNWTLEEWEAYRVRHVAACERWPAWANNVGKGCVRMAERNIERLRAAQ